jgi:hypothetical protein
VSPRPPLTRLAVVGSRCLAGNAEAQRAVLQAVLYWQEATPTGQLQIVSGGAVGVDAMAQAVAEKLGLPTRIFEPDAEALQRAYDPAVTMSETERRQAGWAVYRARNEALVEHCTHLLCVRCPRSATGGSFWTQKEAQRRRKVYVLPEVVIDCGTHRPESA